MPPGSGGNHSPTDPLSIGLKERRNPYGPAHETELHPGCFRDLAGQTRGHRRPAHHRDGRKFRYAKAGSAALASGSLGLAPAGVANHLSLTATAAAVGDRVLSVTVGATAVAENAYEDGFLQVAETDGSGRQYRILSNTACAAGGTVVVTLAEALRAALTTASKVSLVPSPWCGVTTSATEENLPAGVTPCDVPAGHYYFAQTGGVSCCRASGTPAVGSMLVPAATAGSSAP